MKPTIFFVAGKSGGHIIPALTLAQQQNEHKTIGMFTTDAALDQKLLGSCSYVSRHIQLPLGTIARNRFLQYPQLCIRLLGSWWTSMVVLYRTKPERVISTGGLVSVPVCIAAWMLRIPIEVHEFNVKPGAAVRLLSRIAKSTLISFEQTKQYIPHAMVTPYPVRYTVHDVSTTARTHLVIPERASVLFIIGGSQGSRFINEQLCIFVRMLSDAQRAAIFLIHQTGTHDVNFMRSFYQQHQISAFVFDYRDDIAWCYQAADYVITRAGSGVLHELLFFKKRALIIPLETATTSHQVDNAQAFVDRDPASWCMVMQQQLKEDSCLLRKLLFDNLYFPA